MALGGGWGRPASAPALFFVVFVAMFAVGLPSRAVGRKGSAVVSTSSMAGMGGVIPIGSVLRLRGAGRGKRSRQDMGNEDEENEVDSGGGRVGGHDGESGRDEESDLGGGGSWGAGDEDDGDRQERGGGDVGAWESGDGEDEGGMEGGGGGGGGRTGNVGGAVVRHGGDRLQESRKKGSKMSSTKASKRKKGKFDWKTWQRIELKNKDFKPHDLMEPIRGDDGALFQAAFHGGQVLQKQVKCS